MKRFIITILIFAACCSGANAIQDIKKVYLNEAIEAAVKNNIDLQAAQIDINIAKNNIKVANRLQNPELNAFYFLGGAGASEPKQIGASQSIEIAKRSARKNLAISNLELTQKNVNYTTFDLKMDVREAYINLVAAKSVLEALEQQQELQEELLEIARNRTTSSKEPEIDTIQVEIALNQLITQVNTANVDVKTAISNFNKIINDPNKIIYDSKDDLFNEKNNFEEMETPNPNLKFPSTDTVIEKALQNRYDIQIAKQEIDIAQKNLIVVARQRVPDIELSSGYAYQVASQTDSGHFNSGAYVGASIVNIPLFYNYSPEIQNAAFKVRQAELKYNSVKNKAVKDITAAYERFLTAAENLSHYETKILKNSEQMIEMSKDSYENGETDITALIVMKQSYRSIIIGYTYALAEYYNDWTNFLSVINDEDIEFSETTL